MNNQNSVEMTKVPTTVTQELDEILSLIFEVNRQVEFIDEAIFGPHLQEPSKNEKDNPCAFSDRIQIAKYALENMLRTTSCIRERL